MTSPNTICFLPYLIRTQVLAFKSSERARQFTCFAECTENMSLVSPDKEPNRYVVIQNQVSCPLVYLFKLCVDVIYGLCTYMLCQVLALSCLKNFSAQSDLVLYCASDNKRLELELWHKIRCHNTKYYPGQVTDSWMIFWLSRSTKHQMNSFSWWLIMTNKNTTLLWEEGLRSSLVRWLQTNK